jgi:hypothetical protein
MDFSDWIHDVCVIDPRQKHLKKDTPVYEFEDWIEWYAEGLSPTEAVSRNYKEYG